MIDTTNQIDAIHREVSRRSVDSGEVVSVLLRREYDAPVEDVWNAVEHLREVLESGEWQRPEFNRQHAVT